MLRVLFRIRSDVGAFPGGDFIQLQRTKTALEEMGVQCQVAPGLEKVARSFDLVHIFNTLRIHEPYLQFVEARRQGVPVVFSTIWHSVKEYRAFMARRVNSPIFPIRIYCALKEAYYARRSGLPIYWPAVFRYSGLQRNLVESVDAVLPNSRVEERLLRQELRAVPRRSFVIPNGVDWPEVSNNDRAPVVVCAGRIEPRKNQLAVLRAFREIARRDIRLVFYGAINSGAQGYSKAFQRELCPGWIEYGGALSYGELLEQFRLAKVVVLASYFETTGLTALEGLAQGANAVVSDTAYTREYFEGCATFCRPESIESIATAIKTALEKAVPDVSSLRSCYSWKRAAEETLAAYSAILA